MTDTPIKQQTQSKTDNIPGAKPSEQKKTNRNNDRKRNRRGDSKNLERDSDWQERVVQIRRVSKTVKGGKKMSFRAIVVVGNEKGQVGVGVGKAGDVIGAVRKGVSDGKKNLVRVPLTPNNSIPTLSIGKDGAANVLIRPAAPGTGVIAGGSIRTVLELAGIKNVLAKRLGSKTPLNNARAAMVALSQLRTHKSTSRERGISLEQLYS